MPEVKLVGLVLLEYLILRGMSREEAIANMREHNQDMSEIDLTDTK